MKGEERIKADHLSDTRPLELIGMPQSELAMRRIEAWYHQAVIDRPPIRFSEHNAVFNRTARKAKQWSSLQERWFDAEYHVDSFMESIRGRQFRAETFPVFCPNLGPGVYAAFHGAELEFGEITSWASPCVDDWSELSRLQMDWTSPYFRKIEQLTRMALEKCPGQFLVGYTDLHGSLDCAADWRGPQNLCMDIADCPEKVGELVRLAEQNFLKVYDYFDTMLKAHGQPSVTWMAIPSLGRMHIPSCDFSTMVSQEAFDRFYLPALCREVKAMTHNIFHLDGKGVARHLDRVLEIPEIQAIQWVQGLGEDQPIMQWIPLLKKIRAAGKSVMVDLTTEELDPFIAQMPPEGVFLCLAAGESEQDDIIRRVEKW